MKKIVFLFFVIFFLAFFASFFINGLSSYKKREYLANVYNGNEAVIDQSDKSKSLEKKSVVGIFVGDVMLSRFIQTQIERHQNDYIFPFRNSLEFLKKGDFVFGNLEGPISNRGKNQGSIYSFRADPKVLEGIKESGFNLLSLANNHIWDWGRDALNDTFDILNENGIIYVGAGKNYSDANQLKIKEINGIKFGFLGFSNLLPKTLNADNDSLGLSDFDKEKIKEVVVVSKDKVDYLIVSFHWGEEYQPAPLEWQKTFARNLIDNGAKLIIGHHPHVVQPYEKYGDGHIFYSLGNFIFDQNFSKETMEGMVVKAVFSNEKLEEVEICRNILNKYYQPEILCDF